MANEKNRLDEAPRRGGFYNVGSQEEPRWVDANGVAVPEDEVGDAKKEAARLAKESEKAPVHPFVAGLQGGAVVLTNDQFTALAAGKTAVAPTPAAGRGKSDKD